MQKNAYFLGHEIIFFLYTYISNTYNIYLYSYTAIDRYVDWYVIRLLFVSASLIVWDGSGRSSGLVIRTYYVLHRIFISTFLNPLSFNNIHNISKTTTKYCRLQLLLFSVLCCCFLWCFALHTFNWFIINTRTEG